MLPRSSVLLCVLAAVSTLPVAPQQEPAQTLLTLLGIPIAGLTGDVGVTCDPVTVIGPGTFQCNNQLACCTGTNYVSRFAIEGKMSLLENGGSVRSQYRRAVSSQ
ncbi:hypothetical protein EDD85DRAFT_785380 [Armillaria nabsnona]|nr:hypothetical protein EDD85DRAFT_785380 [Armillaria nabsnona]